MKANLLNNYYKEQTFWDDGHAELPALSLSDNEFYLESIILIPLEALSVLKLPSIRKASDPKG